MSARLGEDSNKAVHVQGLGIKSKSNVAKFWSNEGPELIELKASKNKWEKKGRDYNDLTEDTHMYIERHKQCECEKVKLSQFKSMTIRNYDQA